MGIDKKTLENFIATDREVFRAQATDALQKFTPDDRELAASLETEHTSADDILRAWAEQVEPMYIDLERTRHDMKFKKYLIRTVGYTDAQADATIDYMIDGRKQMILDEVLTNLYPVEDNDTPYQRDYAENLLSQSDAEVNDFMSRYIDFMQALEAAESHHVVLCDPHASWLERQRTALQIHKERKTTAQNEDDRLHDIGGQLQRLKSSPDSLVGRIVEKEWNFVTILDLHAKYQKQVDAMTAAERKNPSKRLKLFERVTQSFRDRETERLSRTETSHSLITLRKVNEEVYNLLLEIFDLNTTHRNRLLLDIQQYTRLVQERDLILLIQRNREHFLAAHN